MTTGQATALLSVRGLHKGFPGVQALAGADLEVRAGEIHALIGANGAGKSTLIKVLAGIERADHGTVEVDGAPADITDARRSRALGLRFIHQEMALVPRLSIADNLALADVPSRVGVVRRRQLHRQAAAAIADHLPGVDTRTPVANLSVAQQWLVSLAKVHVESGRIVFLDEPTAALGAREVGHLFAIVRGLAATGVAVVFVSHRLDEVLELTHRVTVMRAGRTVATRPTTDCDRPTLVRLITGHDHVELPVANAHDRLGADHPGDVVLEARNLSSGPVRNVSLSLRVGEVLGIGGLVGSGRTELLETLCGARTVQGGEIVFDGRPVRLRSPADAVRRGIALLPEDRHSMALFPARSIRVNTVVAHLAAFARRAFPIPARRREESTARSMIDRLRIASTGPEQHVDELSGGNQQKVIVGRWLTGTLRVFLVDEPTKGVDVDGKTEILRTLRALASRGVAVVVVSSELDEVAAVADRVVVLREGELVGEIAGPTTGSAILAACFREVDAGAA